jgi:hypothetical protein
MTMMIKTLKLTVTVAGVLVAIAPVTARAQSYSLA